jgi:hypothetical protein
MNDGHDTVRVWVILAGMLALVSGPFLQAVYVATAIPVLWWAHHHPVDPE